MRPKTILTPTKMSKRPSTSANEPKKQRAKRNKNPFSPFSRVMHCKGLEGIKDIFEQKIREASQISGNGITTKTRQLDIPCLQPVPEGTPPDTGYTCFQLSKGEGAYPTVKIRLTSTDCLAKLEKLDRDQVTIFKKSQESVPLDLHRLAAMSHDWNALERYGKGQMLVASHLCHNRQCFNPAHLNFESTDTNRSRDFCEVWILVHGIPVNVCYHTPKCLNPGSRVQYPQAQENAPGNEQNDTTL